VFETSKKLIQTWLKGLNPYILKLGLNWSKILNRNNFNFHFKKIKTYLILYLFYENGPPGINGKKLNWVEK